MKKKQNPHTNAGDVRDEGSIPGPGRSPRVGKVNPLQHFCLENPMDKGAWQATVHRIAKSQTWLSNKVYALICEIGAVIAIIFPFIKIRTVVLMDMKLPCSRSLRGKLMQQVFKQDILTPQAMEVGCEEGVQRASGSTVTFSTTQLCIAPLAVWVYDTLTFLKSIQR